MPFVMGSSRSLARLMCDSLFTRFKNAKMTDESTPLQFFARLMGLIDIERTTNFSSGVPMSVKYDFDTTIECLKHLYTNKYHPYIKATFLGYFDELSHIKPSRRLDRATSFVVDTLKAYKLERFFVYFAPLPVICVDLAYHLYGNDFRQVLDNLKKEFTDENE